MRQSFGSVRFQQAYGETGFETRQVQDDGIDRLRAHLDYQRAVKIAAQFPAGSGDSFHELAVRDAGVARTINDRRRTGVMRLQYLDHEIAPRRVLPPTL
jgi:hypothetical protein